MPDFRRRRTTATLGVGASCSAPSAGGPEDAAEGEEGGQFLSPLRGGDTAPPQEPEVEATQNARRFVEEPAPRSG